MGVERARVTEVHAPTSATGRAGSGYFVTDRLVLTAGTVTGRRGPTGVRPAGGGTWLAASVAWMAEAGDAALLELDGGPALPPPAPPLWGRICGRHPMGVTAVGYPPADRRPEWVRDPEWFLGHVSPPDGQGRSRLAVTAGPGASAVGDGMSGAALFAGAQLVGVLVVDGGDGRPVRLSAVPVAAMAGDGAFVRLVGGGEDLPLAPVSTLVSGFAVPPVPRLR